MDSVGFTSIVFVPTFILFVVLMNMVFFEPVRKILAQRDHILESDKNKTKEAIEKAEAKVAHYEEALHEARHKASEILAKATEKAHHERLEMIMQISDDLKSKKHSAAESLEQEKEKAIANLSSTIREITALMVGKILDQEVNLDLTDEKIKKAFVKKPQAKLEVAV